MRGHCLVEDQLRRGTGLPFGWTPFAFFEIFSGAGLRHPGRCGLDFIGTEEYRALLSDERGGEGRVAAGSILLAQEGPRRA